MPHTQKFHNNKGKCKGKGKENRTKKNIHRRKTVYKKTRQRKNKIKGLNFTRTLKTAKGIWKKVDDPLQQNKMFRVRGGLGKGKGNVDYDCGCLDAPPYTGPKNEKTDTYNNNKPTTDTKYVTKPMTKDGNEQPAAVANGIEPINAAAANGNAGKQPVASNEINLENKLENAYSSLTPEITKEKLETVLDEIIKIASTKEYAKDFNYDKMNEEIKNVTTSDTAKDINNPLKSLKYYIGMNNKYHNILERDKGYNHEFNFKQDKNEDYSDKIQQYKNLLIEAIRPTKWRLWNG